jgi:hypothetical protein
LYDEEKDDFRTRLDYTLYKPGQAWLPIDSPGWVISRNYTGQKIDTVKINFLAERTKTISWLKSMTGVNWDNAYSHPRFGIITAGDLLVSWLTYDCRHIRQFANLNVLYSEQLALPYSTRYASL